MLRWFTVLLGVLVLFGQPEPAVGQKPPAKGKAVPKDQVVRLGELQADLVWIYPEDKRILVQYHQRVLAPNPQGAAQNAAEFLRRQQEILRDPNPLSRRQQLAQLIAEQQQNQANAWEVKEVPVLLELDATDELMVRLMEPPLKFDKRGKPLPYTVKELKALRGTDPKQPGFTGEFDNLKHGQTIQVTVFQRKDALGPRKPLPKKEPPKLAKPRSDLDDADPDVPAPKQTVERALMTRVVVLKEPPPPPP